MLHPENRHLLKHPDRIWQNHAGRPQLPLSRFPDVARIQELAVLNKVSGFGYTVWFVYLTNVVTLWQHYAAEEQDLNFLLHLIRKRRQGARHSVHEGTHGLSEQTLITDSASGP